MRIRIKKLYSGCAEIILTPDTQNDIEKLKPIISTFPDNIVLGSSILLKHDNNLFGKILGMKKITKNKLENIIKTKIFSIAIVTTEYLNIYTRGEITAYTYNIEL